MRDSELVMPHTDGGHHVPLQRILRVEERPRPRPPAGNELEAQRQGVVETLRREADKAAQDAVAVGKSAKETAPAK